MAHEIATPQKNAGSFLVKLEADATSMECVPQTSQPTRDAPGNENATHASCEITNLEYKKSDHFQAKNGAIEIPHDADPLLTEMERLTNMREEAFRTYKEKIMQLQWDYRKEYEMLREKYNKMIQNVDTAVALEYDELARQRNIVLENLLMSE